MLARPALNRVYLSVSEYSINACRLAERLVAKMLSRVVALSPVVFPSLGQGQF